MIEPKAMPFFRFPLAFPTLRDEAVALRELGGQDIPPWFARATDAESADLAGDPVPESIELGIPWLARQQDLFRKQAGIRWAIVPSGSPVSIGTVGLTLRTAEKPTAELGIVVAREYWGKGFGTTAARMAVRYGLVELGLDEVRAEVLQRNAASIRLLEKVGFKRVRVLSPTDAEPEVMILYALSQNAPTVAQRGPG